MTSKPQSSAQKARNRLGGLARRNAAPERVAAARADLEAAKIRDDVASWPPLTDAQRIELAALLLTGDSDAA